MKLIPKAIVQRLMPYAIALVGGVFLIPTPAHANSWPPMAVPLFYLPLVASVASFGVGFLFIVLLEAWILAKRLPLQRRPAIQFVAEANLLSTIAGLAVVLIMTGLPYQIGFPGLWSREQSWLFWGIFILFFLGVGLCTSGFLKRLTPLRSVPFLVWSMVWVAILVANLSLLGVIGNLVFTPGPLMIALKLVGVAIYFSIGFVLSVVIEGFWLARRLPTTNQLGSTILLMNIRSYSYIAIPITVILLRSRFH